MDLKLAGKRALVSGSTSGIGAAIARRLAREGARVIVHGRNEARARNVIDAITGEGGEARMALGDIASDAGVAEAIAAARAAFGGVDILVNNAGAYDARPWFEATAESWRSFYDHDVIAAVRLIHAFAPPMREAGWGRIVNIATAAATMPPPVLADYAAAKAALVSATVSLAKALAGTGVGVCTVSPGLILTDGVETLLRDRAKQLGWAEDWDVIQARWMAEMLGSTSVKRLGHVDEVADLVAFMASPLADYVVGENIRIDGGLTPTVN
jgi:3-oxoacyl-[acyl-carrier protein] reductase